MRIKAAEASKKIYRINIFKSNVTNVSKSTNPNIFTSYRRPQIFWNSLSQIV